MDHLEASRIQASERYLLGELSDAERDTFEEHFFSCSQCAEEVRAGAAFIANARAVFREDHHRARENRWLVILEWLRPHPIWATAVAAVMLSVLLVSSYQALIVLPRARTELAQFTAPQPLTYRFLRPVVRGDEQRIEAPPGNTPLAFSLDVVPVPGRALTEYLLGEFRDASDRVQASLTLRSPGEAGGQVNVSLSTGALPAGRYALVLRELPNGPGGKAGEEVSKYEFVMVRK